MATIDDLRKLRLYEVWRRARERGQFSRFEKLLSAAAGHPPYSEADCRQANQVRAGERRQIPGTPNIVAFGAKDWEQHGLWQAFERRGNLSLFEYPRHAAGAPPTSEVRASLGKAFLRFLDEQEKLVGKFHLAYLYAAGFWIEPAVLTALRSRGVWTVVMGLDDKQQLPGSRVGDMENWQLEVARLADVYWTTWRGGTDWLAAEGATPWYAPEGADPELFSPQRRERNIDVLWIGRSYGARVGLIRTLRRAGIGVHAVGPGWPSGPVPFEEMIRLIAESRLVVGMGGVGQSDAIKHLKGRDFEVPMCGAAYLTSFNPELSDFFDIGKEILCYASALECVDVIRWAIARPEMLEGVRKAARSRAVRDHSWDRRIDQLFALLPQSR